MALELDNGQENFEVYNRADLECLEQNGNRNVHLLAPLAETQKEVKTWRRNYVSL